MIKYVLLIILTLFGAGLYGISTYLSSGVLSWTIPQNIGLGLFTSFFVTLLIETMNDMREKRNKARQKEMIFINLKKSLWNCYLDLLFRLNSLRMSLSKEDRIFLLSADAENQIPFLIEVLQEESEFEIRNTYTHFLDDFHVDVHKELVFAWKSIDWDLLFLDQIITGKEKNSLEIPTIEEIEKILDKIAKKDAVQKEELLQWISSMLILFQWTITDFSFLWKDKLKELNKELEVALRNYYFDAIYSNSEEYILSHYES